MDFLKSSAVVREISIDLIKNDPTVQPRFQQSEETIFRYALCLANGDKFTPIDVFDIGTEYLLADGGHRLEAYRLEGRDTIWARVHQSKRKEALIFASGCNEKHGLLRNNLDKHRVVENVLKDPELGQWSNKALAKICMVSHPFVGKVRERLTCNGFKFDSVRVDANGRKMDTTNIGQKRPSVEPQVSAEAPQPENRIVQLIQDSRTEKAAAIGDREATTSEEIISTEKIEPQIAGQTSRPPQVKKVSIKQLEDKLREYENLILLKDEEIYDLKEQNAYLTKKIKELMEKYSVTENSEIEEDEAV